MDSSLDSDRLTQSAVNIKTRDHIRRVETGKFSNPPNGNGSTSGHYSSLDEMDGERRPLLGHNLASTLHAEPGFWRHLLVNPRGSPGTDSPNPFVKWPARAWNVTKVTLFSCTCGNPAPRACRGHVLTPSRSLDQPAPRFRPAGYRRRPPRMERAVGVLAQLLRHHPARRRALVRD